MFQEVVTIERGSKSLFKSSITFYFSTHICTHYLYHKIICNNPNSTAIKTKMPKNISESPLNDMNREDFSIISQMCFKSCLRS